MRRVASIETILGHCNEMLGPSGPKASFKQNPKPADEACPVGDIRTHSTFAG